LPVRRIPTRKIIDESQTTAAVAMTVSARETKISHGGAAFIKILRNMMMGAVSGKKDNPTTTGERGAVMTWEIIRIGIIRKMTTGHAS